MNAMIAMPPARRTWANRLYERGDDRFGEGRAALSPSLRLDDLRHDAELAAEVQRHLLTTAAPVRPPYEAAGCCLPCDLLAGDFYDFVDVGDSLGVVVGDVSGKGFAASLVAAGLRSSLRARLDHLGGPEDLGRVMGQVNMDLARDTCPHQFATMFFGIFQPDPLRLTYCSGGHDPAILVRDGRCTLLTGGGMAMGIDPAEHYEVDHVALRAGDVVVVYTDGITEARDAADHMFTRNAMCAALLRHPDRTAAEISQDLIARLGWYRGAARQTDDITLVTLKVDAEA